MANNPQTYTDEQDVEYSNYGDVLKKAPEYLEEYSMPDSVKEIGEYAFSDCCCLQSIKIPRSVTNIGYCAFWSCDSLQSIKIPDSVTEIGESAFSDCSSLQKIKVDINNQNYCADSDVLFDKNKTILIRCSIMHEEYTIPDSVTEIKDGAFSSCSSLRSINIPDSVTKIGDWAFSGCSSLQSINLPNSITKIGDSAFDGCSSLHSINIPNSVTKIGRGAFKNCRNLQSIRVDINNNYCVDNDVLFNKDKTILIRCLTKYKEYTIPNSVMEIGEGAFENCRRLQSINIPDSVTKIGVNAFSDCHRLQSINIPDSVTFLGDGAFNGCSNLQNIKISDNVNKNIVQSISNDIDSNIEKFCQLREQLIANRKGIRAHFSSLFNL